MPQGAALRVAVASGTVPLPMRPLLATAVLLATLVAAAPASAAQDVTLPWLRGVWTGTFGGDDARIDIRLALTGRAAGSTVALTGEIDCSGTERLLRVERGTFVFAERILQSTTSTCLDRGVVRLTPRADGRLLYRWRSADGRESSRAVLRRAVDLGG